ncbi:MAG: hypothetical protein ABEJ72_03435, partial [Candidatus Aenigmatarchaeota archaeon]
MAPKGATAFFIPPREESERSRSRKRKRNQLARNEKSALHHGRPTWLRMEMLDFPLDMSLR